MAAEHALDPEKAVNGDGGAHAEHALASEKPLVNGEKEHRENVRDEDDAAVVSWTFTRVVAVIALCTVYVGECSFKVPSRPQ